MVLLLMRNCKNIISNLSAERKRDHFWENNYKEKQKGTGRVQGLYSTITSYAHMI